MRIVFAYPDTAWGQDSHRPAPDVVRLDEAIAWLGEQHGAEIVTLMLDFGQGRELEALRDRALAAGAVRAHVLDVADEFTARFLLPALRAGALFTDGRPNTPALARMMIARKLVDVAAIEQTNAVAHGYAAADRSVATAVRALDASLTVMPVPPSVLGTATSLEGNAAAGAAPLAEPASVDLTFVRGAPTAINGVPMSTIDMIGSLDMLSGTLPGRLNRRGSTAAMVMHDAHRALQTAVAAGSSDQPTRGRRYTELIAAGAWFSSERQALDAAVEQSEQAVSGTVRLQLVHNECRIVEITPLTTNTTLNVTTTK